jgi:hypothetical protein
MHRSSLDEPALVRPAAPARHCPLYLAPRPPRLIPSQLSSPAFPPGPVAPPQPLPGAPVTVTNRMTHDLGRRTSALPAGLIVPSPFCNV